MSNRIIDKPEVTADDIEYIIVQSGGDAKRVPRSGLPYLDAGSVNLTPSAANTATTAEITFDTPFPDVPAVTATPYASNLSNFSLSGVTKTGFKLNFTRASSTAFTAYWIAVYKP